MRVEKCEALMRGLKSQQSLFTKVNIEQEALEIAKRGKPFTDEEMIKECVIALAEEMCPEKIWDIERKYQNELIDPNNTKNDIRLETILLLDVLHSLKLLYTPP
ncbi:unnamed protein product [Psylliodes chrysocephalus]|uniref:Uncharacterized protein n=1 Tax=Psylliodes chrysocephalus TaxID=3402493 RepID=A0A9P0GKU3_9CUCU|nr:unnamed protein product [Psylliodes chrysocephala]